MRCAEIAALQGDLRGPALLPGEPGYDAARAIWNALIDRRPGLILQALGATDGMRTVDLAQRRGSPLAVRGGGRKIAGNGVCDGGMAGATPFPWHEVFQALARTRSTRST